MLGTAFAWCLAHPAVFVLAVLFIMSEAMALNPNIKANGLFQLVLGFIKKQPAAQELAQEILK